MNTFLARAGIADPSPSAAPQPSSAADLSGIADRIAAVEGTGQNPRSSARGIGQFTDDTLIGTYRRHYGENGMTRDQILALKDDPNAMRSMLGHLVQDNADALAKNGHPVTPGSIYLANHFGAGGAHTILSADPSTPIERLVTPDVIAANPYLAGKHAGDVISMLDQRMDGRRGGDQNVPSDNGPPPLVDQNGNVPNLQNSRSNAFLDRMNGVSTASPAMPVDVASTQSAAGSSMPSGWDLAAGSARGLDEVGSTFGKATSWATGALDGLSDPVLSALGVDVTKLQKARAALDQHKELDQAITGMADDPNSTTFGVGRVLGNIAGTLPIAGLRTASTIPALARAVASREAALSAGEAVPWGTRMAAALARYGDMAAQGAAGAGLSSDGKDVGTNMATGALLAPVVGAGVEKVAPKVAALAEALKLYRPSALPAAAEDAARVTASAADLPPLPKGATIRTGAEMPEGALPGYEPGVGGPAIDPKTGERVLRVEITGEDPPPLDHRASVEADVRTAMGSPGLHNGIEATTHLPAPVTAHVASLVADGVPMDQALREADIVYAGAKPTIAAVTRNPVHQEAVNQGAKLHTPEGQALNAQVAQNNAAVTAKMQDLINQYGGTPDQGEVAETVARALAKASDESYGRVPEGETPAPNSVRALYDAADREAAGLKAQTDATNNNAMTAHEEVAAQLRDAYEKAKAQAEAANEAKATRLRQGGGSGELKNPIRAPEPPVIPPAPTGENAPGYIDLSPLREALNSPELANPTIEGGKALRSGTLGLLNSYGGKSGRVNLRQAEKIRQAVNGAYDPMGSGINHHVRMLKDVIDKALDETQAGPAYRAARAAAKAHAAAYEDPKGVADLIRRDAQGNFLNADKWRQAEKGLVGTINDKSHAQVVRQLKAIGAKDALQRLKAAMLQPAVNAATRGAPDSEGNAIVNGAKFFDTLNSAGMPKLNALFEPDEIAHIATIGRAANHMHQAVPGTNNTSNTTSTALNSQIGRRLARGIHPDKGSSKHNGAIHAGISMAGGAATLLGHTLLGPVAAIGASGAKLTADHLAKRSAAKAAREALTEASDPAAARAAAKAEAERVSAEVSRRIDGEHIGRRAANATGSSKTGKRIEGKLSKVLTRAGSGAQ